MISSAEIQEFAAELGLQPRIIEKDYVLGWLLAGIYQHPVLSQSWLFKGGTCLKKCFFETYRFSEDLDFTLTDAAHLDEAFLHEHLGQVCGWIYETSGIEMPLTNLRFDRYQNRRGQYCVQGRISYRGPFRPGGDLPRVKLDLTADELVVGRPQVRDVFHPYSDCPEGGIRSLCYSFEELVAEKMRALVQRLRPRDLYDVVNLYRRNDMPADRDVVFSILSEKCDFVAIPIPTFAVLDQMSEKAELAQEWSNMLAHQLPFLPPFEQFWAELPNIFAWLHGAIRPAPVSIPLVEAVDTTWRPPAAARPWGAPVPLEIIRFAAANHLCVDLKYQGTWRLIEPYSLYRSSEDNLVLRAVKHQTGEPRSYRIDRIEGARATETSFSPRYAIELTPSGPLTVTASTAGYHPRSLRPPPGLFHEPRYIIECPVCRKRFTRKLYDLTLREHKDQNGVPCWERSAVFIEKR
ncbi:MAG TPA: nucleotidyl transferase AbiEii/AbiGii toxin family protein [Acidobacteriota bacterium]